MIARFEASLALKHFAVSKLLNSTGCTHQPATVQRILRHSSITVTTGTYVEVIEAVQRDALDSMGSLFDDKPGINASH